MKPVLGQARSAVPLLATVLLLILALGFVARAGPYTERAPSTTAPSDTRGDPGAPAQVPDARGEGREEFGALFEVREVIPANVLVVVSFVLLVALAVCGALVALGLIPRPRLHRRRVSHGGEADPGPVRLSEPDLTEAVDQALERVEHGEAREAVIACWLLLGRSASEAGSPALPSETAREYAERLSEEQLVSASPLARLAELYREARFSQHLVGADLRAEARRALGVLQAELPSRPRL